ncbi:MAG: thioredoxin reductase, partial [Microbacteriaceae bacterium]|nr:thioredoxin reductase [Microbacteriaceae bacterium]
YVIHRNETLRASKTMQDRALDNPKIEFIFNKTVEHIYGDEMVTGVSLRDTVDGTETTLDLSGLFIAIGADPRTHLVHGQLDITTLGTIEVDGRSSRTNLPGVFAAGDVIDPSYRQAVTAAASGTVAALDAEHYLASIPKDVLDAAAAAEPAAVSV